MVLFFLRCGLAMGLLLVPLLPAIAETPAEAAMLKAPEVLEHTIDSLVALSLGVFAVIGFFGKDGLVRRHDHWRCWQTVAGLAGVGLAVLSLFFSYRARLELMEQLAGGAFSYDILEEYARAAWALVGSALFAFIFAGIAVAERTHHGPQNRQSND
jgi:hypothetical protein